MAYQGYGGPPGVYSGVYSNVPGYGVQLVGYAPSPAGYMVGQAYSVGPAGYSQTPTIDPQIQQWFMSVDADRSGRITAHELQRALVNTNWTQFNEETCRLMIGMFDKDFSGTIDLYEFQALFHYIQQWKQTFDRYDINRTGSIEGLELQQAFMAMGYNVSPQFVQTVVIKFDHYGRRSLTLDSFIQACVMLKSLTDAFRQRDISMSGYVRMSYEDFMSLAVLYKP